MSGVSEQAVDNTETLTFGETREAWLNRAVEKIKPIFVHHKYDIPPIMIGCGFPSTGGLSQNRRLGECWSGECTFNGIRHILMTVTLGHQDTVKVLGVLVHELLRACLPPEAKHGPEFRSGMKELGLEGKARSAMPGADLQLRLEAIAEELGAFPNHALKPKEKTKKDRANAKKSFKLFCEKKKNCDKQCGLVGKGTEGDFTVNSSRKSLVLGFPMCPCGNEMQMPEEDYELYKLGESAA